MENLQGGMLTLEHRYIIEQLQGRHAFVTMYRGTHEAFRRPVWIGIYDAMAEAGGDLALADALRARALEASALVDDGVLRIIDYGELEEGIPFVVSERISAPTLQSLLEREGALDPASVAALVRRLAAVLDNIHARRLHHGNFSPRWIYLPEEDPTRAMVAHAALGLSLPEMRRLEALTLGVDALWPLPPEAFEADGDGGGPDVAADVYALGLVAYQALVGQHPYFGEGTDPSDGILRMGKGAPRPLEELGVEAGVGRAVARALDPSPSQRWDNAQDFARALSAAIGSDHDPEALEKTERKSSTTGTTRPRSAVDTKAEALPSVDHEPSRLGTFAAVAAALLVVSNLGWLFLLVGAEEDALPQEESTVAPAGGIELHTEPPQARVVLAASGVVLGQTPLVLDPPHDAEEKVLRLRVEHDGFQGATLDLRRGDDQDASPSQQLVLHLHEER